MKILIACALHNELPDFAISSQHSISVVETGVGKAAAAHRLTKAICEIMPDYVLNIGTAGTIKHCVGDILISNTFVDRDFQRLKLPGIKYQIKSSMPDLVKKWNIPSYSMVNTGDDFVTETEHCLGDAIDMEAFAEAFVCQEFQLPFVSIKYITDIVGQNSVKHWEDKLQDARVALTNFLKDKM